MIPSLLRRQFASLVFPVFCRGCEKQIIDTISETDAEPSLHCSDHWCPECLQKILGSPDRCKFCAAGLDLNNPYPGRCRLCHNLPLKFGRAFALGNYRGLLRQSIIRMKRDQDEVLAFRLGRLLGSHIEGQIGSPAGFDMLFPIPTHWTRQIKRGFNSAALIAEGVGSVTGVKVSEHGLICLRPTKKQGTLSTAGRFANVKGAFGFRRKLSVDGLNLLIIDDVMTSGATLDQAAKTLLRNGAASVCVGIVARGARGK